MSVDVCEVGGDCKGRIEQHHDDYARPDETRSLCRRHHKRWHRIHGRAPGSQEASIMLRASLTRAEWTELQKIALDRNMSPRDLVAETLRAVLGLKAQS